MAKKLSEIDRKAMFDIKNNLGKLPVYLYNKDFYNQKLLLKDIPSYKPSFTTVTSGTQERIFTMLISFFNWCVAKGFKESNPFDKQKLFNDKSKEEKVVAYTQKDLEKLFVGDNFKRFSLRFSARYWVPLFSLYMGVRRSEIAGLDIDDVKKDKFGRWYIQSIKTPNSGQEKTRQKQPTLPVWFLFTISLLSWVLFVIFKQSKLKAIWFFPGLDNKAEWHC